MNLTNNIPTDIEFSSIFYGHGPYLCDVNFTSLPAPSLFTNSSIFLSLGGVYHGFSDFLYITCI